MTNLNSWHSKHPRTSWKQKFWTLLAVVSNRHSIFDEFFASNMRNFRVLKSCFYSKANGEHTDIFLCRLVHPSEKKWNQWPMRYNFFRFSLGFEGRASLELEFWTKSQSLGLLCWCRGFFSLAHPTLQELEVKLFIYLTKNLQQLFIGEIKKFRF